MIIFIVNIIIIYTILLKIYIVDTKHDYKL